MSRLKHHEVSQQAQNVIEASAKLVSTASSIIEWALESEHPDSDGGKEITEVEKRYKKMLFRKICREFIELGEEASKLIGEDLHGMIKDTIENINRKAK